MGQANSICQSGLLFRNEASNQAVQVIPVSYTHLLEKAGLLKLKEGVGISATVHDVTGNPKNLNFYELDAAMLPRSLEDFGIAVINGNFALQAGLSPTGDSLFLEESDSPFANVIAVRNEDKENSAIQKLINILTGPEVKEFIEDNYKGGVIPAF